MKSKHQTIKLVMLVGDSTEANYINKKVIEISGFAEVILTKSSMESAIDYLRENEALRSSLPEIIFLDISHPISGHLEFLDTFEQSTETVKESSKIMIFSNSLSAHEIDELLEKKSVVGYISKPLLVEKLKTLKSSYLKAPHKKQRIN